MEHAIRILEGVGELTGHQNTLANLPDKRTMFDKALAGMFVRIDDAHGQVQLIANQFDRFQEIGMLVTTAAASYAPS